MELQFSSFILYRAHTPFTFTFYIKQNVMKQDKNNLWLYENNCKKKSQNYTY